MTPEEKLKKSEIESNLKDKVIRLEVYKDEHEVYGSNRFFTLWPHETDCYKYTRESMTEIPQCGEEEITMWDIFSNKYVTHSLNNIGTMSVFVEQPQDHTSKGKYDHERTVATIAKMMQEIDDCDCCEYVCCDKEELQDVMLNIRTQVQDTDTFAVWDVLRSVEFKAKNLDDMQTGKVPVNELCDGYLNFIRAKRIKAFEELDQLEEEVKQDDGTAEDLEDIDTIKQMFRDIPQDIDMTKFDTPEKMLEYWPSLLTPKPDNDLLVATYLAGDSIKKLVDTEEEFAELQYKNADWKEVPCPDNPVDGTDIYQNDPTLRMISTTESIDDLNEMLKVLEDAGFIRHEDVTQEQREQFAAGEIELKVIPTIYVKAIEDRISELE